MMDGPSVPEDFPNLELPGEAETAGSDKAGP